MNRDRHYPLAPSPLDPSEPNRNGTTQQRELLVMLQQTLGVLQSESGSCQGGQASDAFDFLKNNLPLNSRLK